MPETRVAFTAPLLAAACLVLCLVLCLGCAHPVLVDVDASRDLARYRTWSFGQNATATLASPKGQRSPLNRLLAEGIEGELTRRGYQQQKVAPDLLVTYSLELERRTILEQVPRAPYLLSSLSSSPSFWVEGSDLQRRQVSDVTLFVDVSDGAGHPLWSGESRQRLRRGEKLDLAASIATLLESIPESSPAAPAP